MLGALGEKFYAYAVIDKAPGGEGKVLALRLSRKMCREYIEMMRDMHGKDPATFKVRRAKVTLFSS